jgi:hypothetical protein
VPNTCRGKKSPYTRTVERAVARLAEAPRRVVSRREHTHIVAGALQADCRVDHQPFGAANAEVRMNKHNATTRSHPCETDKMKLNQNQKRKSSSSV